MKQMFKSKSLRSSLANLRRIGREYGDRTGPVVCAMCGEKCSNLLAWCDHFEQAHRAKKEVAA